MAVVSEVYESAEWLDFCFSNGKGEYDNNR
jgi:hypothetical protein